VIAVYRPGQIAGFPTVVDEWRRRAAAQGIPLFVLSVDVGAGFDGLAEPLSDLGVDGTMGFPPHNHHHAPASLRGVRPRRPFTGNLYDYGAMVRVSEERLYATDDRHAFPTVMVNFDNTARRQQDANVWVGANPYTFRRWLNTAVEAVQERPEDERIVFVNAWNEWAEGAILEPTNRFGRTYLQAVRDVVGPGARQTS
jgi:lipopolysaccharide biosynthesis protein